MNLSDYVKEEFKTPVGGVLLSNNGKVQDYLHWHPHYEILYVKKGDFRLEASGIECASDKPTVFVHHPFSLHTMNVPKGIRYIRYVIHVDRNAFAQFPANILDMGLFSGTILFRAEPDEDEQTELDNWCGELVRSEDVGTSTLLAALILRKISQIYASGRGEAYKPQVSPKWSYIQEVLRITADNLSENITISDLCERFGVGRTKLIEDFRKVTGSTYKKYLTDLRMTRARELLTSGSSIIDVSLETGYSSEAHFIATYKSYWGVTPGSRDKVRSKSEE